MLQYTTPCIEADKTALVPVPVSESATFALGANNGKIECGVISAAAQMCLDSFLETLTL